MIALPFIFFLIWFLVEFRRTGINGYSYILLIYLISSFCSILIDINDYYAWSCPDKPLGLIAPLLYLLLLTFCISPFRYISKIQISKLSKKTEDKLLLICLIYVVIFVIVLITSYSRIQYVLSSGDLANIRNEQYSGEAVSFYDHLSGLPRMVCAICSIVSPSSYFMLFVFGYMMAFSNRNIWIKLLPIIGSLTPLVISINIADRSQYFYWVVLMGLSIAIFYKSFSTKSKIYTLTLLSVFLGAILAYFIAVSVSRFEMRDGGTEGGIILYAGMSYLNFCTFINYLTPPFFDLSIIFPTINRYIFNGDGYFYLADIIEAKNNIPIATFPTFLGIIYSVCGPIVLLLFVVSFHLLSKKQTFLCKKYCSDFHRLTKVWILAIVPALGVIGYFYMNSNATIAIAIWLLILKYVGYDKGSNNRSVA